MGVNRVGFGITDDEVVCAASSEANPAYFRHLCEFSSGQTEHITVSSIELLMQKLDLVPEDRVVVTPARQANKDAMKKGKGRNGIFCGAAMLAQGGRIVTGKNSEQMRSSKHGPERDQRTLRHSRSVT